MIKYPVSKPSLSALEREFVLDAMDSTWISSTGKYINRFEDEFAKRTQTDSALAVSNGTVSLHLILLALGIGPGDEVIVPSFTYVASVNAITYVGATPVFCDVDPLTWCLDPNHARSLITKKTAAIMVVHLYGHPADMDPILDISRQYSLATIEDAAEAPFSTYKNAAIGSLGDAASFSFYGNKVITSGEGGAVATSNNELATKMRLIRGQGMDPNRRYWFPIIGHNFRLTNISAAILCAQLERLETILNDRNSVCDQYESCFDSVEEIISQPKQPWATWTPWFSSFRLNKDSGISRDSLLTSLLEKGIDTRPFFIPAHTLPAFRDLPSSKDFDFPFTFELAESGFNLPTYSGLTNQDVDFICSNIVNILK